MFNLNKIHITPDDYLAKFEEYDDAAYSHVKYYIEPYGPHEINEMSDTHYVEGDIVPYHEHARGYETFLIDKGSVEITVCGKTAVAGKGDMVHIAPYTAHKFRFLEHDTVWRELFQEIQMNSGMMEHLRVKEYHRERIADPEYHALNHARHSSIWYDYEPAVIKVSKHEIPQIRTYESGLAEFKYDNCIFRLKVSRAETAGVKEIWQMVLDQGKRLRWDEQNPYWKLYVVFNGSVTVEVDGEEKFVAKERDIIHVPSYLAGSILTNEDTVLLDYNCQGYLFRAMEELKALKETSPENFASEDLKKGILKKNDCYIWLE